MITTSGMVVIWCIGVMLAGAVLGAIVGLLAAYFVRHRGRDPWRDAVTGGVTLLVLNVFVNSLGSQVTFIDDHTVGWRAIILDHQIAWAITAVVLMVNARQLWAAR